MSGAEHYWTDASSLDALSTCSDSEGDKETAANSVCTVGEMEVTTPTPLPPTNNALQSLFSPSALSTCSVDLTTPTPTGQSHFHYPTTAYLFGDEIFQDDHLKQSMQVLEIQAVYNPSDFQTSNVDFSTSILVFQEFSGSLFESLRKRANKIRIYGPPILKELASLVNNKALNGGCIQFPLPRFGYPLFCRLLRNAKVAVTGIRVKEELADIRRKILYMDGVYLEREGPPTHLVAAKCRGVKYRDAVALDKPILKPQWIHFVWANRANSSFLLNSEMSEHKVKAFYGARIALEGFDGKETSEMRKLIEENEGSCVSVDDPSATHVVKSSSSESVSAAGSASTVSSPKIAEPSKMCECETGDNAKSPLKRPRFELNVVEALEEKDAPLPRWESQERAKVLRAEWFWTSIQIEACADESQYLFHPNLPLNDTLNTSVGTPNSFSSPQGPFSDVDVTPLSGTPSSALSQRRKRKRLMREFVSSLAQVDHPRPIPEADEETENVETKGKTDNASVCEVSDSEILKILQNVELGLQSSDLRAKMETLGGKPGKRLHEFAHLIETERNYVTILRNIIKIFKEPCEQDGQKGGRLLSPLEVKTIFNPITPIYSLHKRILRDMLHILQNYVEESLIGQIYVKNAEELRKCYEPFVQSFESVKEEILRCERENPRFMAFLRISQGKPQCGKEKLVELIIRPVQRLPSTALILKSLEKNTEPSNPDYEWITKGVEAIDRVNQTINKKKEQHDARRAIFDVYGEVDGCPVEVISDHRTLLKKYDVTSPSEPWKNDLLTLIVFTDHFQIVKRKGLGTAKAHSVSLASVRSPAVSRKSLMPGSTVKRYKYLEWVSFSHVKKIVNINDCDPKSFGFIVRAPDEVRERILIFTTPEDLEMERLQKISVVEFFAKQLAHSVARVDYENFITSVDASSLKGHDTTSLLSKVGKLASKTSRKVGRVLSFNRTPSKLKRTVSQMMMSPFSRSTLSRDCEREADTISQSSSSDVPVTPMSNHMSTISFLGSKRSTLDCNSTPRSRKFLQRTSTFTSIQES